MPKKRSAKYEKSLKEADEAMRKFDEKLITEISARDVEQALSGFALSTRNLEMRMLKAVFNFGIKRGYLTANPIDKMDFAELESGEVEVFTPAQAEAMLNYALERDLGLLPWLTLGLFSGIRPEGELAKLKWSCIHLTGKAEVEIPASVSKTRRRRFVDLSENAVAWLEAYRQRGGSMEGLVTPYQTENLRNHRKGAQKAAGINKWIQQGMRHTFCSAFLAARRGGVSELVLQSGHTDPDTMWRSYHRGMSRTEAEKFRNLHPLPGDKKILPFQAVS
jgi:integrase